PNDSISAYYVDFDTGQGNSALIETSAQVSPEYALGWGVNGKYPTFSGERPLFGTGSRTYGFSTSITLPFEFPYFDKKYATARIYSDGLVAFDMLTSSQCKDTKALANVNGIAPLWLDLAYGGAAQENENIYMSSNSDSVTIRWAAETQPLILSSYLKPDPVNFAVTLYRDGSIRTYYNPANMNLVGSSLLADAYGCGSAVATIGMPNGHETYSYSPFFSG